ncbi:hypothetical protein CDAR_488791 [Caerostris darwini]|uniref:Uncharacterized protein n=1 Tax=Caerostris darwini TaxID=1538125 RepID=A0AAV4VHZ9_9ARAC|nr:hypothetical protein CDAR_488791 [Caerostris darwini]
MNSINSPCPISKVSLACISCSKRSRMIAKVALLLAALAAVDATVLAPGLLNAGLLNAGLIGPSAITTGSVVSIPGAVTTDKRVIGTTGLIGASPLLLSNGLIGNGLLANGLIANGLVGAPFLTVESSPPLVSGLQESLLVLV